MSPAERPLLSILLLCHNEAVFIRRALRSILEQSLQAPVEILLLDDHSQDGSAEIARAEMAASPRRNFQLTVLRSPRQLGNAQAFVTALGAARGRYYHVLDADDYWIDPDKLQSQIAALEADPALEGVAHRSILRSAPDGSESFHPGQEPLIPVLQIADFLTGGAYFHTSAMLYRNSFYDPDQDRTLVPPIFHDVRGDTIRLYVHAFRGGIRYLPQTMSVYDNHRGGIWSGLDWPGRRALLENLHRQLANHGYLAEQGEAAASAFLAEQLAAIAAHAPGSLRPISLHPAQLAEAPRQRLSEISRIASLYDLERQLSGLAAAGELAEALTLVFRFLAALGYDPNLRQLGQARRLHGPEIDWHCARIGGLIAEARGIVPQPCPPEEAARGPLVLLVSGLAEDQEGRWALSRDMVALWRGRRRIVVVSTELEATHPEAQARLGGDVTLMLNTDRGFEEKTAWLIWHLARLKPAQILVNPARHDVVIAAGLRREHAPRIDLLGHFLTGYLPLCHHGALDGYVLRRPYDAAWFHKIQPQRRLALLPHFAEAPAPIQTPAQAAAQASAPPLDADQATAPVPALTPALASALAEPARAAPEAAGRVARWLGAAARSGPGAAVAGRAAPPAPLPAALSAPGGLVTATAASRAEAVEARYDYSLDLVIPLLLRHGARRHLHLGPLSPAMRHRINRALLRGGLAPETFCHLPEAFGASGGGEAGLAAGLRQGGATVFLQGFPWPEPAALVSAMALGLPVIAHENYLHPALSLADLCPPGAPSWRDPEGLAALLAAITPAWEEAQRAAVRAHMAGRQGGGALLSRALGSRFMAPLAAAALPAVPVPEDRHMLRRLLTEALEMTMFRL